MTHARRAAAVAALLGMLASCSTGGVTAASPSPSPVVSASVSLPTQILGLRLTQEDIGKRLKDVGGSYLDSVSLLGLREQNKAKTLRAALEVGHFNALARPESPTFRSRIVAQIGTSVPQSLRLADREVFMSAGQLQYTFMWFSNRWMYMLTVRRDYPFVRTLVRRLVEGSR